MRRGEYLPTLPKWCEMELIRLGVFNAISELSPDLERKLSGILCVDSKSYDATLERSVHDYRRLTMSQRELLMTRPPRAQLDGKQAAELDSIAMMMVAQTEDPPAEDPPDDQPPLEDPPPDKESPTDPGQPAPMKSAE